MKSSWSNKTWVLGVCAMMVGNICTFVSTAFAPVSLLAVLGSTQFVANVIFSSTILGETVTPRLIVATFFITGGCILLVLFGNRTSVLYTGQSSANAPRHHDHPLHRARLPPLSQKSASCSCAPRLELLSRRALSTLRSPPPSQWPTSRACMPNRPGWAT